MILGFALLLASFSPMQQPAPSDWQADLKQRRDALITKNGPGTDAALRTQLLTMGEQDQSARGFQNGQPVDKQHYRQATNLAEIDKALTDQLRQIVTDHGWPTIALVGIEASNAAMLVLTHTADHAWQKSLLPQLESLADHGQIDGSSVAIVIDKDLIASGQPQRYGSQFKLVDGEMAMFAVEDPGGLDRSRALVLLPPMDVYRQTLMNLYHLKISPRIVSPTPPSPQQ